MANWTGGQLTAAGKALQAKVEAGATLELTRLKLGDGTESASDIDALTDLVAPKYSMSISSKSVEDNVCTVTGVVLSTEIHTGFYAREFGIFALDPDVGEILYMISLDPNPDYVPPSSTQIIVSAEYAMAIAVDSASNIQIDIDPNGLVTVDMLRTATYALRRSWRYEIGDVVGDSDLPNLYRLSCIVAGTTGTVEPDFSNISVGDHIIDGSVTWEVVLISTISVGTVEPRADVSLWLELQN